MANETTSTTTAYDQEKFLAAKLLQRAHLKLIAMGLCDKEDQPKGTGKTAYFVRYTRMNVPLVALTEGTPPSNNTISLEQLTVTLDQWGDVITITDVAELTTKHPLMKTATDLLSDNAQRVMDREVQIVMLAGTNVTYGDGSTATTRKTITTSMKVTDSGIIARRIALGNAGCPPREGPGNMKENAKGQAANGSLLGGSKYLAVTGLEVAGDIQATAAASGLWVDIARYQNAQAVYVGEIGSYLNFRWVETNFMPRFQRLGAVTTGELTTGNAFGTNTPVVTAVDGGGSLTSATAYYFKVTRKDKTRGFEEYISEERWMTSTATANNESFTFDFSSLTAGYVYNLYFGSSTGDANLKLAEENIEVGDTVTVTSVPGSTTTAPVGLNVTGPVTYVYPIYMLGAEALVWVGLQNLKTYITGGEPVKGYDPLGQLRQIGYKFMGKTMIKDQTRLLRWEVASAF